MSILFSQLVSRSQLVKPQEEKEGSFACFVYQLGRFGLLFQGSPSQDNPNVSIGVVVEVLLFAIR